LFINTYCVLGDTRNDSKGGSSLQILDKCFSNPIIKQYCCAASTSAHIYIISDKNALIHMIRRSFHVAAAVVLDQSIVSILEG
jgi:hypothetical protein